MRIKCDYCGEYIEDTDKFCGVCGAPNDHLMRSADGIPKTIEELKRFCDEKKLPLEKMRFFIGQDFKEPRAFGIYKDENGNFIVYKNKADGTRAVRYRGTDEAYAVNEIYQKMKSEIQIRKKANSPQQPSSNNNRKYQSPRKNTLGIVIFFIVMAVIIISEAISPDDPDRGYYRYKDSYYYYQNDNWYLYGSDGWDLVRSIDDELEDNYSDYFESTYYDSDYGTEDFEDTEYYYEAETDEDDWNDDWDDDDWDFGGDWDAGDTDWNTDW